ncbi:MAG TPA: DUF2179 domain-containing protein [Bacillota bacterium]|jgi:uncharacterized protein YebE (UPF0316 family)|nr:DUF2179 domain-containing protein [Bacillota bacterium]HOA35574.1 DUF2179 domain-containing protein [Bacillota bacterium]HOJ83435.1 DUF2179 domain-containing protein [Bacillota bacterium]HOL16424.1 DUF2179 domain-containing protein [Bacillota bacterium]HPZ11711.1 DUF2179 domain-containing protein [Bacillota bacterium]
MHLPIFLSCLIIFICRVVDVSLGTVRIIYLTRGQSKLAAVIGFVEMIIYIIALGTVMGNLDHPLNVVFYALGFSVGSYVGSRIEEMIAVGHVNVQIITMQIYNGLEEALRQAGFGVTSVDCSGKEGPHRILYVMLKRRDLPSFMKKIKKLDKDAFISIMDTRKIVGGYFNQVKAK